MTLATPFDSKIEAATVSPTRTCASDRADPVNCVALVTSALTSGPGPPPTVTVSRPTARTGPISIMACTTP